MQKLLLHIIKMKIETKSHSFLLYIVNFEESLNFLFFILGIRNNDKNKEID